jgi:hypothetical protein
MSVFRLVYTVKREGVHWYDIQGRVVPKVGDEWFI